MYRAYLMRDRVGEKFDGRITGVTHFGVFVEFENPFVEGLIKIASLGDDFFDFDAERMQLSGRATGLTLALGDEVEVEILNVSVTLRRIELALVATRGRRRSSKRSTPREAAAGPPLKKKEDARPQPERELPGQGQSREGWRGGRQRCRRWRESGWRAALGWQAIGRQALGRQAIGRQAFGRQAARCRQKRRRRALDRFQVILIVSGLLFSPMAAFAQRSNTPGIPRASRLAVNENFCA